MTVSRHLPRLLAALSAAVLLAAAGPAAAEPLKVGFVYVSPIGDAGWTYQHELGRRHLEAALGDKVETSYVESVPEGADAERVIREFAAGGYGLVFTTSFGYMNPTIKVAKRFPDVAFEHATGYKRAENVGTYLARFYEGRYLTGLVAGKMTKSNTVGYVAAFPIPEVVRGINAFTMGLRSVNPEAEVRVVWVSSWYDPGKEREAAETLIAQGADVITQHTDSTAPVQAAEEKGVYAIGYHSDMSKYGPTAHLTASTHNWSGHYLASAKAVLDGNWAPQDLWGGIKDGMVELAPFGPAVPAEVKALAEAKQAEIAAGTLHPFQGPVKDQAGTLRVAEGSVLSDQDMLGFDWYVEGVLGKLPK
ncbi:MAG: BMP family ABC transporter substrate-binding protein [Rhodospirillales bacterium]|nr:BMP family ABC transporter substrate-binding protein [Rhodospirillales bacterium]MDH3791102.1 BMP family ABC transporter substrate-binding protein [Rhodospirillales bacterium]MDH3909893.1 BMP family ABC transporter substrate-binding protein [Rhodospirillales bacterium]MDH3920321.1 BMP family ABC transporter substrate-binding protein [Rhodospirillales bacterium]